MPAWYPRVAVCCSVLQCVAVCCKNFAVCCRYVAVCCILSLSSPPMSGQQHTATHCSTLHHTATHATHRITLQSTATDLVDILVNHVKPATNCNKLQHTAAYCNILQHTLLVSLLLMSGLQYTAIHCNTLQQTATDCITLHHTAGHLVGIFATHIGPPRVGICEVQESVFVTVQQVQLACVA